MKRTIIKLGESEVELPSYMVSLPQSFIDIIQESSNESLEKIVSCGIDPQDGNLYIVTSNSYIGIIKSTEKRKPISAFPGWNGEKIYLSFEDLGIQGIDSSLMIKSSINALNRGIVNVSGRYLCDIDLGEEVAHEDANNQTP